VGLLKFNSSAIGRGSLAFAQFFHDYILFLMMTAYSDKSFRLPLFVYLGGSLVQGDPAAVDAGRLAFAQFFHDFVYYSW